MGQRSSFRRRRAFLALVVAGVLAAITAFALARSDPPEPAAVQRTSETAEPSQPTPTPSASPTKVPSAPPGGVYRSITTGHLSKAVGGIRPLIYVPNNSSNTVSVIDPATYRVIRTFPVGYGPQHITPSWDLRHLYVGNAYGNSLTEIDPKTGRPTRTIPVPDPYNLYFTLNGSTAIVVAERLQTLYFYDPHTWRREASIRIPFAGLDHLDFSADGHFLLVSAEFSGEVAKVNLVRRKLVGTLHVGGSPIDVKLAPDGSVFYVANQIRNGVSVIDPVAMRETAFIPTGAGAHGFCVSRDARDLYVSNRLAGSISVVSFATDRVIATWHVGGSPDMLQVSADGRFLWASNRYDATVSVISTKTGKLLHTVTVGQSPHGLTLFPQPGRFSIGHNGVYR